MELEGRLDSLLGGRRDLRQRPRAAERERDNARDRAESMVRKIDEAEGMAIEERDRECYTRAKAVRGFGEGIADLGNDLERDQDEAGTAGVAFTSAKSKVCRLASNLDGVREWYKRDEADRKDSIKRERGRGTRGLRKILIGGWRILGYGTARGYDRSRPRSTVAEDEGMRFGALDKWYLSSESSYEEYERGAE